MLFSVLTPFDYGTFKSNYFAIQFVIKEQTITILSVKNVQKKIAYDTYNTQQSIVVSE